MFNIRSWLSPCSFRDARDPHGGSGEVVRRLEPKRLEEVPCTYPLVLPGPVPPEDTVDNRLPRKALDGIFD